MTDKKSEDAGEELPEWCVWWPDGDATEDECKRVRSETATRAAVKYARDETDEDSDAYDDYTFDCNGCLKRLHVRPAGGGDTTIVEVWGEVELSLYSREVAGEDGDETSD